MITMFQNPTDISFFVLHLRERVTQQEVQSALLCHDRGGQRGGVKHAACACLHNKRLVLPAAKHQLVWNYFHTLAYVSMQSVRC